MTELDELKRDYTNECAKLGDLIYRRKVVDQTIDEQFAAINKINVKAAELNKEQKPDGSGQENPVGQTA